MDQSTQVNFPTGFRRNQSSGLLPKQNLYALRTNRSLQTIPGPLLQIKPPLMQRPKSLNLSSETFHRSKISFLSELTPKSQYPSSDLLCPITLPISRERTPPLSIASQDTTSVKFYQHRKDISKIESGKDCNCFIEDGHQRNFSQATPEGLSWRRLHMSRAKLKATSTTSELLSGFAMVAMVELQINEPTNVPEWLFIMFAVCTTVLVSVHIFALMISTYILPNIDAISKLDMCELVAESPHERMRGFIELAWAFSTVLGLFLFLVEVAILCWVKFWDYSINAAISATVVIFPVLIIFVLFVVHFYHSLVVHRCDTSVTDLEKLEELKKNLDEASSPL